MSAAEREEEERRLIDPNAYLQDCFRLAELIWRDGYRPDFLVGLWRGGAPPGIVIQEFFRWKGQDPYHTAIRTQSLEGVLFGDGFDIKGFEHVIDVVEAEHRMLLVDDLFDTGRTMYEVIRYLRRKARRNTPEVRVAVVYYRPDRRRFLVGPHYYLHETRTMPIFPHRLTALTPEEIRAADPEIYEVLFSPTAC
ncbi:MAG: phosphoribosyltransferase [Acidobacteriota bacterium]